MIDFAFVLISVVTDWSFSAKSCICVNNWTKKEVNLAEKQLRMLGKNVGKVGA